MKVIRHTECANRTDISLDMLYQYHICQADYRVEQLLERFVAKCIFKAIDFARPHSNRKS